jgi:hypothetical protein
MLWRYQQKWKPAQMDDRSDKPSWSEAATAARDEELAPQLWMMVKTFWYSPGRNKLFWLGVAVCVVVALTAFGQIKLNAWNKPFYDALSLKDFWGFLYQLVVFAVIAGALLALNVAQAWLRELSKLKLREGLTRDLFDQWLVPRRAFRLSGAGDIGVNPDQRIHEDARHLVDLSTDLGIGLLQSTLLLASFITVLWTVSESVTFSVAGLSFALPGYMVWFALIYAGIASFGSWRVGRPLIALNAERYAREADLRFGLYRAHAPDNDNGVIAPTAALSNFPYAPEQAMRALRHFYDVLGDRIWGRFGFTDAFSETHDWYASTYLAIDQGPIVIMIENYRSGLLWKLFMADPDVRTGLARLGFSSPHVS